MINLTDLAINFGNKSLFENSSLTFDPGKCYGIVGANGTGKSTLLRLISGDEKPVSGTISVPAKINIGVLRQNHFQFENITVTEVVLLGKPKLCDAMREKNKILQSEKFEGETGIRLGQLEEIIAEEDGYVAEPFAAEILSGLGIDEQYHTGPMSALSGGYKLRVLLAQLLFQQPDVLLLDEPTNHLDIISIRWLENYLSSQFKGTLLVISHDRNFLNAVASNIVDIDYEELRLYSGNYEQFLESKLLAETQKLKELETFKRKTAEMQAFIDRFRAKATKARQAQSRVKQLDKMEVPEVKQSSRISPSFCFEQSRHSGRTVLTVNNLCKSFAEKTVLKNISFEIQRGEKVAIIGPNGIGKSTLLKIILDEITADEGIFEWGYETKISYFAQDHHEQLDGKINSFDWLYSYAPHESIGTIRGLLGRVLISGDEALKQVSVLSGGESARLLFARIMLEKNNVLILDEPTNHMDLEGVEALGDALNKFDGTVVLVSHYRHFVEKVADHILEMTSDGIRDFSGSYNEYLENFGEDHLGRTVSVSSKKTPAGKLESQQKKLSFEERKNLQREISKLNKQAARFELLVEETEKKISEIESKFGIEDFFQITSREEVNRLKAEKGRLSQQLSGHLKQWEISSQNLENAKEQFDL